MAAAAWKKFPYDASRYAYEGAGLKAAWPELHRGDCEPFPDAAFVDAAFARHPQLKSSRGAEKTAEALQEAWRAYHRGDFGAAVEQGSALGPIGANPANKAANIYATYLESESEAKRELLLASAKRATALQAVAPDFPNAFYLYAQALGRYAQEVSIVKALAEGTGGKVKASLDKAIALAPRHAEAHIALGAYHAEIVSKVGGTLAKLTYGATRDEADQALCARPQAPARIRHRPRRGGQRPRPPVRQGEARRGGGALQESRQLSRPRRDAEARHGTRARGGGRVASSPHRRPEKGAPIVGESGTRQGLRKLSRVCRIWLRGRLLKSHEPAATPRVRGIGMFIFSKPTGADAIRMDLLTNELQRKRQFAAQLREEATGPWAEDYLALAELEEAKAEVIEAQLNGMR